LHNAIDKAQDGTLDEGHRSPRSGPAPAMDRGLDLCLK
jgi:hypothetical protein